MAWKTTCAMKERVRFITEWDRGELTMIAAGLVVTARPA
jgi:hypothetical protein